LIPLIALAAVVAMMGIELRVSRRHERQLRAAGAREAPGDVYPWMRIVYPACFVAMAIEALVWPGPAPTRRSVVVAGVAILAAAKLLKTWAIVSLGPAWSFRVLVRPSVPLVASGPYRHLRHPNYVAIVGELLGMAAITRAPVAGIASLLVFGVLLWKRVQVEEQALGLRPAAE